MFDLDNLIRICTARIKEDATHSKALNIRASAYIKKGRFGEVRCGGVLCLRFRRWRTAIR